MSYSIKLTILGMELQFDAADQKDLWRQVSLFQALPEVCPIDDTPTRLNYRYVDENDFFAVVNSGPFPFKYPLGQYKKGGDLFAKNAWVIWDVEQQREVTLWEDGRLTPAGERYRIDSIRRTAKAPAALAPAQGQPAPEAAQIAVAGRQAPNAVFIPPAPEQASQAVAQQATVQVGNQASASAPDNPFIAPDAGARSEEREPYILSIFAVAKSVYGPKSAGGELLKIASAITDRTIKGLMELDYDDLRKVDAIVKLDQTGFKRHAKPADWYKELAGLLPKGKTVYQLTTSEIDRIHSRLDVK